MFKSRFLLKSILIILAILLLVYMTAGFLMRKQKRTAKKKMDMILKMSNEDFVCSFENDGQKCVEELIRRTQPPTIVTSSGSKISVSWSDSVYYAERRLVNMGEPIAPILIEIISDPEYLKDYKYNAIYILGLIGGEEANEFLISILLSETEDFPSKYWARSGLNKYKDDPNILKILNTATKRENLKSNSKNPE